MSADGAQIPVLREIGTELNYWLDQMEQPRLLIGSWHLCINSIDHEIDKNSTTHILWWKGKIINIT
jgi:hypothetical protein